MNRETRLRVLLFACLSLFGPGVAGSDQPAEDPLLFAQSAPFSGPAAELGAQMRTGVSVAFKEANARGGINGRPVLLESMDDRYEPELTIANVRNIIDEGRAVGLIGGVGTPTSVAVLDMLEKEQISYLAPMTGAESLRQERYSTVLNVRASYAQEVEEIVHWLVEERQLTRIAILYQDDSYGRSGLEALRVALSRRALPIHALATYRRNTTAVKASLLQIRDEQPQAVLIVAAYAAAAEFIYWSKRLGMNQLLVNLSFVGSEALAGALGDVAEGVYISQVVPLPSDQNLPLVERYRAALQTFEPGTAPGFVSLEGYIAGRVALEIARSVSGRVDRATFLSAARDIHTADLDGLALRFGADSAGLQVGLTRVDAAGDFRQVTRGAEP